MASYIFVSHEQDKIYETIFLWLAIWVVHNLPSKNSAARNLVHKYLSMFIHGNINCVATGRKGLIEDQCRNFPVFFTLSSGQNLKSSHNLFYWSSLVQFKVF